MPIGLSRAQSQVIYDKHINKLNIFKLDGLSESCLLDMCVLIERGMTLDYIRGKYKLYYNIS